MRSGDFMKRAGIVVVVILLAAILFELVSARREEAHRRQGQLELIRVKKVCANANRKALDSAWGDEKYRETVRPLQTALDADCLKQIHEWTAAYPDLDKEASLAGVGTGSHNGIMPDGHTLCIIGTDDGCH
jgi:hypothetical protein